MMRCENERNYNMRAFQFQTSRDLFPYIFWGHYFMLILALILRNGLQPYFYHHRDCTNYRN